MEIETPFLPTPGMAIGVTFIAIFVTLIIAGITSLFIPLIGILLTEGLLILPVLFFLYRKNYSSDTKRKIIFRLNPISLKMSVTTIIIGLTAVIVSETLDSWSQNIFPFPQELLDRVFAALQINSWGSGIIIILSAVIFASIFEEMIFRGFLQSSLERVWRPSAAIITSSLIFAVIHFNPWWFFQILLLGFLLGYLAWRSQSIIPGIILHGINNGISIITVNIQDSVNALNDTNDQMTNMILLIALCIFIITGIYFHRSFDIEQPTTSE